MKWDIAEVVDRETKNPNIPLGEFHRFRVRLTNGETIIHSLDMLHHFAKNSEFLKKCVLNKEMGGITKTRIENGMLKHFGFPDCYNIIIV